MWTPPDEQDDSALFVPEIDSLQTFLDLLQELTGDASTPNEALHNLWKAIDANVRAIYESSIPYDAFDVLANVRFFETAGGLELREKLGHQGLAPAVEIAASILRCRPSRHISFTSETGKFNQDDAAIMHGIIEKNRETLRLMNLGDC